jgi:long-subunit acyl-CoA synthetase (AMP-forming)
VAAPRLDHLKISPARPTDVRRLCKAAFAALGPKLAQIYGQGESPMTITAMPRAMLAAAVARDDDARLGSVGVAQTGIEICIAETDGAAPARSAIGEVCVRGPTVMQGYWMNPQASAAALSGGCSTRAMSAASTATASSRSEGSCRI